MFAVLLTAYLLPLPVKSKSEVVSFKSLNPKGNPLTLLVGMQTSTATMEDSVEIPQKTGNRTVI